LKYVLDESTTAGHELIQINTIMRMRGRKMKNRRDRRKIDIYKRTLFSVYFILFEISTQFRWLLGNNI
jgi:hypothetical protein